MIEWIVSSSVLILVVIVLRFILRGRIKPGVQYALWGLVLLRLLVPVSFFSSPVSLMNLVPVSNNTIVNKGTAVPAAAGKETYEYELPEQSEEPATAGAAAKNAGQIKTSPRAVKTYIVPLLGLIWLAGVIGVVLWFVLSNLAFYRRLKRSGKPLDSASVLPVYTAEGIRSPFIFGLVCPAVYVTPAVAADETMLRHILAHEAAHRRHGDNWWSLLRGAAVALHWYNPLVWWAAALSRQDAELFADAGAIFSLGEESRIAYGRTLVGLIAQRTRPADLLLCATTMSSGKKGIKERVMLIAKKPRMLAVTAIAVVLIAAAAVGCTFTGAKEEEKVPEFKPDTVSLAMPPSSAYGGGEVTEADADAVDDLYSAYSDIETTGTKDSLNASWVIQATFTDSETGENEAFQIFIDGTCRLGSDDTYYTQSRGEDLYALFWKYYNELSREAQSAPDMVYVNGTSSKDDDSYTLSGVPIRDGETVAVLWDMFSTLEYEKSEEQSEDFDYKDGFYLMFSRDSVKIADWWVNGELCQIGGTYETMRITGGSYDFEKIGSIFEDALSKNAESGEASAGEGFMLYVQNLAEGTKVDPDSLLASCDDLNHSTWLTLENNYFGKDWWSPTLDALNEAALGEDQYARDYHMMCAYLSSDGAYAEGLAGLLEKQYDADEGTYLSCLFDEYPDEDSKIILEAFEFSKYPLDIDNDGEVTSEDYTASSMSRDDFISALQKCGYVATEGEAEKVISGELSVMCGIYS